MREVKRPDRRVLGVVALVVGLLVFLFVDGFRPVPEPIVSPYLKHLMFLGLTYSTVALSLNLVVGWTGQVSLGHAAFYGIGAYTSALLTHYLKWPFWYGFVAAGVVAALVGIPLGFPALRVRGPFLVVVTYGFAEVFRILALNSDLTGGPAGLPGLVSPVVAGVDFRDVGATGKEAYILLVGLLLLVFAWLVRRIDRSRVGLALAAIREDEIAAAASGIHVAYYKLLAFVLSAAVAGLAGSLYAHYSAYVSSDVISANESILMLTMVVVGGPKSIGGSILGAFILVLAPEMLRGVKGVLGLGFDPWLVIYGLLLIAMMRLRPQGMLGEVALGGGIERAGAARGRGGAARVLSGGGGRAA